MPISYVLDKTRRHVDTTVTGSISVDDILAHFGASRREQALGYAELIDVRGVTPPYPSTSDIWRAANLVRAFNNEETFGPRAVIVGSDLIFGMTRLFTNLITDFLPMRVFRDSKAAEEWLAGQAGSDE